VFSDPENLYIRVFLLKNAKLATFENVEKLPDFGMLPFWSPHKTGSRGFIGEFIISAIVST
jgi:hypothetical protein